MGIDGKSTSTLFGSGVHTAATETGASPAAAEAASRTAATAATLSTGCARAEGTRARMARILAIEVFILSNEEGLCRLPSKVGV